MPRPKTLRQLAKVIRQKHGQALASENESVGQIKKEEQRFLTGHETIAVTTAQMLKPLGLQIKQERNRLGGYESSKR